MPENIQATEVKEIQDRWGDKPCNHEGRLMKEYYKGMATGDYVCSQCGHTAWGSDWNKK